MTCGSDLELISKELQRRVEKAEKEYLAARIRYLALRPRKGGQMNPAIVAAARHYVRSLRAYRRSIERLLALDAHHDAQDC